jgi:MFS-type transporter involved in bile tolerance (Atg22 family)
VFRKAYFGNSIVAIAAGVIGGFMADNFGLVAPFDCSMVMLIVGTIVIQLTWAENTGDSKVEVLEGFSTAWAHLTSNKKIWLVGISQSLFEGATIDLDACCFQT